MARSAVAALQEYVSAVNGSDLDRLRNLFAPDAVVLQRSGRFEGIDEIGGFYAQQVLPTGVWLSVVRLLEHHDTGVLEATATAGGQQRDLVDVCSIDDTGKITRLAIYFR